MLLILRRYICFDGLVAAIVRAWCNFIYQYVTVFCYKHLNRQKSNHIELLNNFTSNGIRFFTDLIRNFSRSKQILNEILHRMKYHLHSRESFYLSFLITRYDNGNLLFKINQLL